MTKQEDLEFKTLKQVSQQMHEMQDLGLGVGMAHS